MECPELLSKIYNPPRKLYTKGNPELLKKECITIVGTRKATKYGEDIIAELLDETVARLNICIVSGMASGIDTMVHKRCLDLGIFTIAVIAGGIENVYPRANVPLYEQICKKGLVVSEFPGVLPLKKEFFPMRNRILAGLSKVTIVIEADLRSGSNITANFALEFGRDVYTIPGDINRNTSRGCNMLIKQGAGVLTSGEDFKNLLGIENEQLKMKI